jgi:hypothetical protein
MTTRVEIGDNFHPEGRPEPVYASPAASWASAVARPFRLSSAPEPIS